MEELGFITIDRAEEIRHQYFYWESDDFLEVDFSKYDNSVSVEYYKSNHNGTHNSYTLFSGTILKELLILFLYEIIQRQDKILKMVG